jgi:16S rRNA (uracil1498-N3)-methyltransferase
MAHIHFFYVAPEDVGAESFVLRGGEFTHAVRVLRLKPGDRLLAVDGCGHRYGGPIVTAADKSVTVAIEEREEGAGEPRLRLTLAQGVPKGGSFDWVVEKGTEAGVSIFQPMITAHTVAIPRGREGRWQEKARAAMKQCGRSLVPEVRPLTEYARVLASAQGQAIFIAWEEADAVPTDLAAVLRGRTAATLLIGPEGGFSAEEVAQAAAAGAHTISLGTRRLRSEAAALVAAVRLLAATGDMG